MLFSIITVCFNSERTIEQTLKSMLNQTFQDYEYIIIDGASTDETMEIVQKFKPLFKNKMKVISEPDAGIYDAMNKGISMSTGDIVGIVNSDDYYEKDALENVSKAYTGEDYEVIYGLLRQVKNGKEVMVYSKNPEFLEQSMIAHPSCFVTRKLYEKYGTYSLKYPYSADYEFMLRIRKNKEIKFTGVYQILSNFSIDGVSGSVKAYRDTLKLRWEYNLIDKKIYTLQMIKSWIAMKLGR